MCHCRDSNSQPFNHESCALTNKLSRLPRYTVTCAKTPTNYSLLSWPSTLCRQALFELFIDLSVGSWIILTEKVTAGHETENEDGLSTDLFRQVTRSKARQSTPFLTSSVFHRHIAEPRLITLLFPLAKQSKPVKGYFGWFRHYAWNSKTEAVYICTRTPMI